jgi:DNA invertase Pin-like site-specific DNA recombinase
MTAGSLRVLGYCRVSTQDQVDGGMSLEAQAGRIRAWAEAAGATLVDVVVDAAVSGTKPLADRPGGERIAALFTTRRPEADAVVVVRLDRLGRDAAEQMALLKRCRTGKVGLVAVAQQIDLATPYGRAMAGVSVVFAELERALIAERTAETLAELRRQGKPWNHAPFGWDAVDGRLVVNDVEQATLARVGELRDTGQGYATVARTLNDEGRLSKRGGPWQAMSVRSVVRTSAHVGGEAP